MSEGQFTRLLGDLRRGDESAADRLYALVYDELRRVAHNRLSGQVAGETMHTTELVHEAYMKFAKGVDVNVRDRAHFFRLAARAMRHILVERARARGAVKRGGDPIRLDIDPNELAIDACADELVLLDDALAELERLEPRLAEVLLLRFFGYSVEEVAERIDMSSSTVKRDVRVARMVVLRQLGVSSDS